MRAGLLKKSGKSEYLHNLLFYVFKWTLFRRRFLLLSWRLSFLIVLVFCLHFCLLSHCEITRGSEKSLITNSTYFLLKYHCKKKTWKAFFRCHSLDAQTGIPVSQTAWIHPCMTCILELNLPSSYIIRCESWFFRLWNTIGFLWLLKHWYYNLYVQNLYIFQCYGNDLLL